PSHPPCASPSPPRSAAHLTIRPAHYSAKPPSASGSPPTPFEQPRPADKTATLDPSTPHPTCAPTPATTLPPASYPAESKSYPYPTTSPARSSSPPAFDQPDRESRTSPASADP